MRVRILYPTVADALLGLETEAGQVMDLAGDVAAGLVDAGAGELVDAGAGAPVERATAVPGEKRPRGSGSKKRAG